MFRTRGALVVISIVLTAAVVAVVIFRQKPVPVSLPTLPIVSTQPTTKSATLKAVIKLKNIGYLDIVRSQNPTVPATQPLAIPLDLPDAAHVVLRNPVYIDPMGHLWITSPDARPIAEALRKPAEPTEHVIPEAPVFVHWLINEIGTWRASIVVPSTAGGFDLITSTDRQHLADRRLYRWDSAFSWDGKIVVPTDIGVSIFDVEPKIIEHYHALPGTSEKTTPPLAMLDARGVLAWAPWQNGKPGSAAVSRFVDGNWADLSTDQWADHILHLLPLLDGSILQIIAADADSVRLAIAPLESTAIDQKHVNDLMEALADPDDDKRKSAFDELAQYGPGIWPLLEKDLENQPPEANVRLRILLKNKISPALAGMSLMDNRLKVVHRQPDGTTLLLAPVGVQIPNGDQDPKTVSPAWLCIRPGGRIDRALPDSLVKDLNPDHCALQRTNDEWIIADGAGVRQYLGNEFVSVLHEDEKDFTQLIGIDHRGRWLLRRENSSQTRPATLPIAETLIIDPTILDPTPKLPVWTLRIDDGIVGWNADNWPVTKHGGPWALKESGWEPLDEKTTIITALPEPTVADEPLPTQPTSQPALGNPILIAADGTRYYGGKTALTTITKSGKQTDWPLPPAAIGDVDPILIRTEDETLFLFNQPGRLLRIRPTPAEAEPFKLEAAFTKDIPNVDRPVHIWLDPAGRIDFVADEKHLSILFPAGHIPVEISKMIMEPRP